MFSALLPNKPDAESKGTALAAVSAWVGGSEYGRFF